MAKHTTTPKPFEAGETNARAVRHPPPSPAGAPAVAQTPQRDAKAGAGETRVDNVETQADGHGHDSAASSGKPTP